MPTDAERLAKMLKEDLARGKVNRSTIARECGITRQAVSNWITTGRISKNHLLIVAKHTNKPISRYLGADCVRLVSSEDRVQEPRRVLTGRKPIFYGDACSQRLNNSTSGRQNKW